MTNQVSVEDTYKARYDVTISINGLPLVQVELKRRGIDINGGV
ncbi:type I restriction endonuclease [Staphylococcus aureus]